MRERTQEGRHNSTKSPYCCGDSDADPCTYGPGPADSKDTTSWGEISKRAEGRKAMLGL